MMVNKLIKPESESEIIKHWVYKDKCYISCVCTTFNQKEYIKDTIDGFLAQETEYHFEIIIHDDLSTDGTRDILLEYKKKYPSIIKLILQDENQYSQGKKVTPIAVSYASGEYLSICEGDDYWVENNKLQKQIELFIKYKNVSLVHGSFYEQRELTNNIVLSDLSFDKNTTRDLFLRNGIGTLTTFFRKKDYESYLRKFSKERSRWKLGDWPIWIYLSTIGDVLYIDKPVAVYRILSESASHSKNRYKQFEFYQSTLDMRFFFYKKIKVDFTVKVLLILELIKLKLKLKFFMLNK